MSLEEQDRVQIAKKTLSREPLVWEGPEWARKLARSYDGKARRLERAAEREGFEPAAQRLKRRARAFRREARTLREYVTVGVVGRAAFIPSSDLASACELLWEAVFDQEIGARLQGEMPIRIAGAHRALILLQRALDVA